MPETARQLRNRLGGLARQGADPERTEAVRAALAMQRIREQVALWPPLTETQRNELAALLLVEGDGDAA